MLLIINLEKPEYFHNNDHDNEHNNVNNNTICCLRFTICVQHVPTMDYGAVVPKPEYFILPSVFTKYSHVPLKPTLLSISEIGLSLVVCKISGTDVKDQEVMN